MILSTSNDAKRVRVRYFENEPQMNFGIADFVLITNGKVSPSECFDTLQK